MDTLWQLWGTFSVADHLRPQAFLSDVLVYDRLLIPVPPAEDTDRWIRAGWQPDLQRSIIEVLREGDANRVLEISWTEEQQQKYAEHRGMLTGDTIFDTKNVLASPDTPAQFITRFVLANTESEEKDRELLRAAVPGLPPVDISVVAAYGTLDDFSADTGIVEQNPSDQELPSRDDLLAGFVWPFAVPDDPDLSDDYLLHQAVEFANTPEAKSYREAFHRWRYQMITGGKSPAEAATDIQQEISDYGDWVRSNKRNVMVRSACVVGAVGAGVAAAVLPIVGLPIVAAYVGAGAAVAPGVGVLSSRLFRGQFEKGFDPAISPGALFWEAKQALA